jgi:hypothetical protein
MVPQEAHLRQGPRRRFGMIKPIAIAVSVSLVVAGGSIPSSVVKPQPPPVVQSSVPALYPANICDGAPSTCHSIGTGQRGLWATAAEKALAGTSVLSDLHVKVDPSATADVYATDPQNGSVAVILPLVSVTGQLRTVTPGSFVSVLFDNTTDTSATTKGVRLGGSRKIAPVAKFASAATELAPDSTGRSTVTREWKYLGPDGDIRPEILSGINGSSSEDFTVDDWSTEPPALSSITEKSVDPDGHLDIPLANLTGRQRWMLRMMLRFFQGVTGILEAATVRLHAWVEELLRTDVPVPLSQGERAALSYFEEDMEAALESIRTMENTMEGILDGTSRASGGD